MSKASTHIPVRPPSDKVQVFTVENLQELYNYLAENDRDLQQIIGTYGYPPLWIRPNTFATLVLTILEQQVSIASAYASFKRLQEKIEITPENLLVLTDDELKACAFSRQKIKYTRILAEAIIAGTINLAHFNDHHDDHIRTELKKLKGIGDWTVDIYLLHALQRTDIFPVGDLALVKAIKEVKELSSKETKEELIEMSKQWMPYRSLATMLLWHYYLSKRSKNLDLGGL
ncbi:MAG TPA: hypothetical protein VNS32_23420 [Flavisolibacter sp.]|nr:hypothetical protein [Flavisolibacter sp.]